MTTMFQLGSLAHLIVVGSVVGTAGLLARWARRRPGAAPWIARALGAVLGVNELIWYGRVIGAGLFRFPDVLPLELCDLVLWLTVVTLFSRRAWAFDLIYYWALAGTGMAVLTPDIAGTYSMYQVVKFFLAHGGAVAAVLFLIWSGQARPRPGSLARAILALNAYVLVMAAFNVVFNTNYLYLCAKPSAPSLLDYFGPWPWYVPVAIILAAGVFALLWLPFRSGKT